MADNDAGMKFENKAYDDIDEDGDLASAQIQTQAEVYENPEFDEIKLNNDPEGDLYRTVPRPINEELLEKEALIDRKVKFIHEYEEKNNVTLIGDENEMIGKLYEDVDKRMHWRTPTNDTVNLAKENLRPYKMSTIKNQSGGREFLRNFKPRETPNVPKGELKRRRMTGDLNQAADQETNQAAMLDTNLDTGKTNVVQATSDDIERIAEETLNNISDDSLSEENMNTALKKGRITEEFKFIKFMREKYQYIREKFRKIKENIKKKIQYIRSSKDYDELEMQPLIEREEENLKQADQAESAEMQTLRGKVNNFAQNEARKMKAIINNENLTIGERLRNLFKLKGFKIGTIVTAVIISITTIGASIGNLFKGKKPSIPDKPDIPSKPSQPDKKPDIPDKNNPVKNGLIKFKNWLLALGDKALLALPSILGSIFSTILKAASSVVGILAEHLIIGIAVTILVIVQVLMTNAGKIEHKAKKISSKINEH